MVKIARTGCRDRNGPVGGTRLNVRRCARGVEGNHGDGRDGLMDVLVPQFSPVACESGRRSTDE